MHRNHTETPEAPARLSVRSGLLATLALLAMGLTTMPAPAGAASCEENGSCCSRTARRIFHSCRVDTREEQHLGIANCINVGDDAERQACRSDVDADREEALEECDDQLDARLELCGQVGEDRYDPDFDPVNFVDPDDIGGAVAPNPYFPLVVGNQWVLENEDETITDTVLNEIKLIEGVRCRVVRDVVEEDGVAIEITDDWYAQDLAGNVWYCGEIAQNFESFEGDDPEVPELVDIDGSFKTGREGAKPGILMLAAPMVGDVYRQEAAYDEAEDVAEVTSITGTEEVEGASCDGDCVVTRDFTPIEPGHEETKYYAPNVGLILEVDEEGGRTELVEFNQAP